jgi:hypothetical protein
MLKNNYNYILNGISHEININSSIKIQSYPLEEKKLLANKFMIKIINDLFDYLSIDYCIMNKTLLGQKIFKGINIFEEDIEILIQKNNLKIVLKEEEYLKNNNISIENIENKYMILKTFFFNNVEVISYIYLFHEDNNIINFYNNNLKIYNLNFYDIFPIKKDIFEEFTVNIPNKVDNVLETCEINLNFITFKSMKMITKSFIEKHYNFLYILIYLIFLYSNSNIDWLDN